MSEISLQDYRSLEHLASNPHYKMNAQQMADLRRGRQRYGTVNLSEPTKHDPAFTRHSEVS